MGRRQCTACFVQKWWSETKHVWDVFSPILKISHPETSARLRAEKAKLHHCAWIQHTNINRNISLFKNLNTCKISTNEGVNNYQDTSDCNESILSLNTSWSLLPGCPTKLMIHQITWQSYAMSLSTNGNYNYCTK